MVGMIFSRGCFVFWVGLAMASPTHADDAAGIIASLKGPAWKEVLPGKLEGKGEKEFQEWTQWFSKVPEYNKPDWPKLTVEAHQRLAPWFDGATKITLYSLLPAETREIDSLYPDKTARLKRLPAFHDYPILGSVAFEKTDEVMAWRSFLQTQIIARERMMCDFEPRHGFRFSTAKGDVDVLMCYHCGALVLYAPGNEKANKIDLSEPFMRPGFWGFSKEIINLIFDDRGIERDK